MGKIILVTGGSRSGKSQYAQRAAEALPGPRAFIATCPDIDEEMQRRIRHHQEARRGKGWYTIEEPVNIESAVRKAHSFQTLAIDCLTLWVNNLLYEANTKEEAISEADIAARCRELITACDDHPGTTLFVTNEVGMGIIPENPISRLYRDLVGRCNQTIAAASDRVIFMIAGQPMELKRENP